MTRAGYTNRRKHTRFKPDPGTIARIDVNITGSEFKPTIPALIFSEAYGGCGLVVTGAQELRVGDLCRVQVGSLHPMAAEIVWRTPLDEDVVKIGLKFLE